jgi:hypothetical protein
MGLASTSSYRHPGEGRGLSCPAHEPRRIDQALPMLERSELADPWIPAFAGTMLAWLYLMALVCVEAAIAGTDLGSAPDASIHPARSPNDYQDLPRRYRSRNTSS